MPPMSNRIKGLLGGIQFCFFILPQSLPKSVWDGEWWGNIQCPGGRVFTLFKSCPRGGMVLDESDTCINLLTHLKHVVFHALSIYVL